MFLLFQVNNAGGGAVDTLDEVKMETMDRLFQQHVKTPLFLAQKLKAEIVKNKGKYSHIISNSD